jgi:uncharacterized repeat protein (TIGR02543 family)
MLIMSILLFTPLTHAEGDPGFTVYAFTASDTTHNLPDDIDFNKVTIFVGGLKVFENGVELYPYDDEVDDWQVQNTWYDENSESRFFILKQWPSEDFILFAPSTNIGNANVINNLLNIDIVFIVADDPDSFNAWGANGSTHTLDQYLVSSRTSIYSDGDLIYSNGTASNTDYVVTFNESPNDSYVAIEDLNIDADSLNTGGTFANNTGHSYVIIEAVEPEIVYEPIYTIENVTGDYNFNEVGKTGYTEIEGLYSLADIQLFAIENEAFIINGELATDPFTTVSGFDVADMFIENGIIKYTHDTLGVIDLIWVTPGKLHADGLFSDPAWGYDLLMDELEIYMDFIYRVPGITGTAVFVTNVDEPIAEGQIRASVTAFDETDGDITDQIIKTTDTYTPNMNTVGEWELVYSVTDSSSNVVTFTVTVFVRDIVAPVIDLGIYEDVTYSYIDNFDPSTFYSNFTITDNYYDLADLTITVDLDMFDGTPKTTVVSYTVEDPSGNESTAYMTVHIVDDVAPVITGPDTMTTSISSGLTLGTILTQYSAEDDIDGSRTNYITVLTNTYTPNKDVAGTYQIVIQVADLQGNIGQKTIEVVVTDDVVPVFYVTRAFISVAESITLTLEDIIRILYVTGQIDTMEGYTLFGSTYFGNELNQGVYSVTLTNGVQLLSLTINVDATAPVIYLIQFNNDGGTLTPNMFIDRGQVATQPDDPVKEGYTFDGWYKDSLYTQAMDWNQVVSDDLVLYAKWVPTEVNNTPQIIFYVGVGFILIGVAFFIKKKVS